LDTCIDSDYTDSLQDVHKVNSITYFTSKSTQHNSRNLL